MGDDLERMVLVFSGYQYSHEKYNLIPYMYEELDDKNPYVLGHCQEHLAEVLSLYLF